MADDNSGFFGGLKSLGRAAAGVLVELPDDKQAPKPAPTKPVATAPGGTAPARVAVGYDPEMYEALQKMIAKRASAYTDLQEKSNLLVNVIPDKSTRIKAAFATSQRSSSDIVKAIDIHLMDLVAEARRFTAKTESEIAAKSGTSRTEATRLKAANETSLKRIEQLRGEIMSLENQISESAAKINELSAEADAAEAEIRAVAARFELTVEHVKSELEGEKASLSALLT